MNNENLSESKIKYDDPDFQVSVVYTDLSAENLPESRWQWHEDIRIIIINNGSAMICSDDQNIRLVPGQAVIIAPNVMHSVRKSDSEPCSYYSLIFHPDFILGQKESGLSKKYTGMLDRHGIRLMILDENILWQNEPLDYLNLAIAANMIRYSGYELATRGYLCLFWSTLVRHMTEEASGSRTDISDSLDEQRVKKAVSYIRQHYAEKITLEDIADAIHLSKSECCRCFKRSIGVRPFEYLMKYRIFEAADMLKDPAHAGDSIADIAMATGFNNLSYFSKLFNKYMDCTPKHYRKNAETISLR